MTLKALAEWRTHLAKRLNQWGFHDKFTAYKEIGRGAFASVFLVKSHEDNQSYAVKGFLKRTVFEEEMGKESVYN